MYDIFQQLINGLTLGSIYALIAIGYTMVYGIIGLINFAHGEIYMIGAYTGIIAIVALLSAGVTFLPILLFLAFLFSIAITSGYGYMLEKMAYKPLRNSPRLVSLISAIGMSIFLQNYVANGQSSKNIALQPIMQMRWDFLKGSDYYFSVSAIQVLIFSVTFLCMLGLTFFIRNSKLGKACRACAEDFSMAKMLGINADKVISLTFIIGAGLASVAGVLVALYYGVVTPYIGFLAGMKAFTAAVLGGIGSISGAVLGGIILGMAENFTSAYFTSEYNDVVAFAILILVLLFRPTGILGKPEVEKV